MERHEIFKLNKSQNELRSSNNSITDSQYRRIAPNRNVASDAFKSGNIDFDINISGDEWLLLNKSYIRIRFELTNGLGAALQLSDGVAPAMNCVATLFQSADFSLNGKSISRVGENFAQCDTLVKRLTKTGDQLSNIEDLNFMSGDLAPRINAFSSDGKRNLSVDSVVGAIDLGYAVTTGNIGDGTQIVTFTEAHAGVWLPGDIIVIPTAAGGTEPVGQYEFEVKDQDSNNAALVYIEKHNVNGALAITNFYRKRKQLPNRNLKSVEVCWRPDALGVWSLPHGLPVGAYRLTFVPHSTFAERFIETLSEKKIGTTATDVKLNIVDMYFIGNIVRGPRLPDTAYLLDLDNIRIQTQILQSISYSQRQFNVSPSTSAVAVFFQDAKAEAGSSLISPTIFKMYAPNLVGRNLKQRPTDYERQLSRFSLMYGSIKLPSTDTDNLYDEAAGVDKFAQRYYDTMLENALYLSEASPEGLQSFYDRGFYAYFNLPKDGLSHETNLSVSTQFSGGGVVDNPNTRVCVAELYKSIVRIEIVSGYAEVTNLMNE